MKLLILIGALTLGSLGAKTPQEDPPKDTKICEDACSLVYTPRWHQCNRVRVCEFYEEHQYKICVSKCEGQSE